MRWISVKDKLPNKNNEYLVIHKDITEQHNILTLAYFTTTYFCGIESNSFCTVTKYSIKPLPNVTFWIDKKDVDVPKGISIDG